MVGSQCVCPGTADALLSNGAIWAARVLRIYRRIEPYKNACIGRSTYYSAIEPQLKSSASGVIQARDWSRPDLSSMFLRPDPQSLLAFCRPFPIVWFSARHFRSIQSCGRTSMTLTSLMNNEWYGCVG